MASIAQFLAGIGSVESGNNPNIGINSWGAAGQYQMTQPFLDTYAAQAGYPGATVSSVAANPSMSNAIATAAATSLYSKYNGNYGAMAAAWLGGPGGASNYLSGVAGPADGLGTTVAPYASKVLKAMGISGNTLPGGLRAETGRLPLIASGASPPNMAAGQDPNALGNDQTGSFGVNGVQGTTMTDKTGAPIYITDLPAAANTTAKATTSAASTVANGLSTTEAAAAGTATTLTGETFSGVTSFLTRGAVIALGLVLLMGAGLFYVIDARAGKPA